MKTIDQKAAEYIATLANQSGNYSAGEVQTAYLIGAVDHRTLECGEEGTFGQAVNALKSGKSVARKSWEGECFVVLQVPTTVSSTFVPKMTSLPASAKEIIEDTEQGSIQYDNQCLIVYFSEEGGCVATYYVPDWQDILAVDWVIVSIKEDVYEEKLDGYSGVLTAEGVKVKSVE